MRRPLVLWIAFLVLGQARAEAGRADPNWLLPRYRAKVAPLANPDGVIDRVFAPAAATDVATLLAALTGPKGGPTKLAILDALPFGSPAEIRAHHANAEERRAYFKWRALNGGLHTIDAVFSGTRLAGTGLRWELERMGARGVTIRYLDPDGTLIAPPSARRRPTRLADALTMLETSPGEIARIRFTLRGRRHEILYVQGDATRPQAVPPVLRRFFAGGVDAVVQKAAFFIEQDPGYRALVRLATKHLHPQHGIVMGDRVARLVEGVPGLRKILVPVHFGYADEGVSIYRRTPSRTRR